MPIRIAGVTLPDEKRVGVALTRLYGVGRSLSAKILTAAGVAPLARMKDLTEKEAAAIRDAIAARGILLEGDLRREAAENIRRLKEIGAYRGIRHSKRLPVRGQRTRTNSRTVRGNVRRTAGSGRRAAAEKT